MSIFEKEPSFGAAVGIVIAGGIVGAALYFGTGPAPSNPDSLSGSATEALEGLIQLPRASQISFRAVNSQDHIRGKSDAFVTIIEYSDTECPFCKDFHGTLQRLLSEYDGKVRWVYRHFPIDAIHSKARKEAEATECAHELGGNDKFWAFLDRLFEVTPSNDDLDLTRLPQIAQEVGLDAVRFEDCLESAKYAARVAADLTDAQAAGGEGTPYSVIVGSDGTTYPIFGAQPYEQLRAAVDQALR